MDYKDENDSPVISIAINDDETKNVLDVGVAQDADVQRVVVGPAVGRVETLRILNNNLQNPQAGETGYLVAECVKGELMVNALLTQDGKKVLTALAGEYSEYRRMCRLFNKQTAVPFNSTFKFDSDYPTGELANLPKILIEPVDYNNDGLLKVLHAPAEETFDGAIACGLFKTEQKQPLYWGDEVNQVYTEFYN